RAPFRHLRRVITRLDASRCLDQVVHGSRHAPHAAQSCDRHEQDQQKNWKEEERMRTLTAAEQSSQQSASQKRDAQNSQNKTADPADEWGRAVTVPAAPSARWERLALGPPFPPAQRCRPRARLTAPA